MKTLQFWALIYKLTGWYSPWAKAAEYKMVLEFIRKADWTIDDEFADDSAENRIGIEIGSWQARHGFLRKL